MKEILKAVKDFQSDYGQQSNNKTDNLWTKNNFWTKIIEAKKQWKLSKCRKKITDNLEFHIYEKHPPKNEDETVIFRQTET